MSHQPTIIRTYIVCLDCEHKHTSEEKLPRRWGRMRCVKCDGLVCLDHQFDEVIREIESCPELDERLDLVLSESR
ncbi:MAG: hypothetical protein AAFV88_04430 [Planctomycetota bacterium]